MSIYSITRYFRPSVHFVINNIFTEQYAEKGPIAPAWKVPKKIYACNNYVGKD